MGKSEAIVDNFKACSLTAQKSKLRVKKKIPRPKKISNFPNKKAQFI